jgi:hypothetical protein
VLRLGDPFRYDDKVHRHKTDVFIAGIRAVSNARLVGSKAIATSSINQTRRVEDALRMVLKI